MKNVLSFLKNRWKRKGGYKEVLTLGIPLILSTGSWSIQQFVARMFLTWYSPEAIAAAMPAGILSVTTTSIFVGTAGYVSAFVAQYYGAKRYERIGPAMWQGIYVALIGALIHLALIPLAVPFFRLVGHAKLVQQDEVIYFQILCLAALPGIASAALSSFFSGLGRTVPVMWVNIAGTALNMILDYILIFGKFGLPELGIKGAAIAALIASAFSCIAYFALLLRKEYNIKYQALNAWRFDSELFARLIRFGLPSGVQFFLDISGFTIFILLVGRLGTSSLAATNIAFNVNSLAFMPMLGLGTAVAILVGQYLGRDNPRLAEDSVYSCVQLTFSYMITLSILYILVPNLFLAPYALKANAADFEQIRQTTVILLRFVAVYSLFDAMTIVFSSAIRGAGDTNYVMRLIVFSSVFVLIIPSYIALVILHTSIFTAWYIASAYVIILGIAFLQRFLTGKWKSMRVIEEDIGNLETI